MKGQGHRCGHFYSRSQYQFIDAPETKSSCNGHFQGLSAMNSIKWHLVLASSESSHVCVASVGLVYMYVCTCMWVLAPESFPVSKRIVLFMLFEKFFRWYCYHVLYFPFNVFTLQWPYQVHAIVIHNIQIYKLYQYTVSCTAAIQIQLIRSTHNHVSYT